MKVTVKSSVKTGTTPLEVRDNVLLLLRHGAGEDDLLAGQGVSEARRTSHVTRHKTHVMHHASRITHSQSSSVNVGSMCPATTMQSTLFLSMALTS